MKRIIRSTIVVAACSFALASSFTAKSQDWQASRFYVKGDLGGTWTPKTDLKEFFGPVTPGSKVKFDPGVRFGVAAGYHVTDWFAGEVETGYFANSIDSITDATRVDAFFANVPLLLNAKFQCPHQYRVSPYFGAGVGASTAVLDADRIVIGGTSLEGSDADVVFAYQAFGGVRYRLNERMGLSLEYRYFATGRPEWEADVTFGTASDKVRFGRIDTHAVSVAFDFSF